MTRGGEALWLIVILVAVLAVVGHRRRWRPAGTAFGTAAWASDKLLKAWGMLGDHGIVIGRTLDGALIRASRYCHTLLIGGTGSGKGVGVIIPNLLSYRRGSVVVFDMKGDLFASTAKRRGGKVIRLAPFNGGKDSFNPLDTIPANSPVVVDSARAMAESLVVRQGTENDPHWNDKAVQVITAVLVFVLSRFSGDERSLASVQAIVSDKDTLFDAGQRLQKMGGVAQRLGGQLLLLFEREGVISKEGAGVISTVVRHLSFLDSEPVERATSSSTFDPKELLEPGVTLYIQIPPDQLEAQRALLRCWISTLVRVIGSSGSEDESEVLFLLDEASALGGLPAIEEALVRGRSAAVRLLLAYQSDSQVRTAFKDKTTLLYDNCATQIHLGACSYEGAERLSKSLGSYTQIVEGHNTNFGSSSSSQGQGGYSTNQGEAYSFTQQERPLLRPEEVLTLSDDYLIAFHQGLPSPILGLRIRWYSDSAFNPAAKKHRRRRASPFSLVLFWLGLFGLVCLAIHAWANGRGYWAPNFSWR